MMGRLLMWWMLGQFMLSTTSPVNAQDTVSYRWGLPLLNIRVTSGFGDRIHPVTGQRDFHRGVDLAAHCDPVLSVLDGTVSQTGFNPILGRYIRIDHGDFQSVYGHLSFVLVTKGESVGVGQPIAITEATGRVTGEHLHFCIRFGSRYINPLRFLCRVAGPEPGQTFPIIK